MEYLQQFKTLPKELRQAVSSTEKMKVLEEIEAKYRLKLAKLVVRVMIKDLAWSDLEKFCQENFKLTPEKASELKKDLTEKIFDEALKYLGVEKPSFAPASVKTSADKKAMEGKPIETMPPEAAKLVEIKKTEEKGKDELELEKAPEEAVKYAPFGREIDRNMQPPVTKQIEIEEIIKEVKEKTGLSFVDEDLEKRFENIVINFLKDIRKDFETEEILIRSEKVAGLGLTPEKAKEVMKILKEIQYKYTYEIRKDYETTKIEETKPDLAEGILTPEEIIKPPVVKEMPIKTIETEKLVEIDRNLPRPVIGTKLVETHPPKADEIDRNLQLEAAKLMETEGLKEKKEEEKKFDEDVKKRFDSGTIAPVFKKLEKPIEPPTAAKYAPFGREIDRNMPRPVVGAKLIETPPPVTKPKEIEEIPIRIKRPIGAEKLVEDVFLRHHAIGPIEELAEITLTDLKRWGGKQTCQIIFNKISLLAEDSLIKKSKGIKAWQKSPLYNLYLAIGRQALETKKTVVEVINERVIQNKETISLEDFEEITELNRRLRF